MTDGARLAARALQIAMSQLHVRETGRNEGPEVNVYLAEGGGLDPGYKWCASFCAWALRRAARELGLPVPSRASSIGKLWQRYNEWFTSIPAPGAVFLHLSDPTDPWSPGHCGFVVGIRGDELETVEGNTNAAGSREGDGVYLRTRPMSYVNFGYVDPGKSPERASHA